MGQNDFVISESLGVCVKSSDGKVFFQNSRCIEKCGVKTGEICQGPCVEKYRKVCGGRKLASEGFFHFPKLSLEQGLADAVVVNDGAQLLTLLYPLEDKNFEKMQCYRQKNLTKRELEIASLLLEGFTNSEIAPKLFISKAAVKTHINNIYKKISVEMRPRS